MCAHTAAQCKNRCFLTMHIHATTTYRVTRTVSKFLCSCWVISIHMSVCACTEQHKLRPHIISYVMVCVCVYVRTGVSFVHSFLVLTSAQLLSLCAFGRLWHTHDILHLSWPSFLGHFLMYLSDTSLIHLYHVPGRKNFASKENVVGLQLYLKRLNRDLMREYVSVCIVQKDNATFLHWECQLPTPIFCHYFLF
jgi:hypothetical protein